MAVQLWNHTDPPPGPLPPEDPPRSRRFRIRNRVLYEIGHRLQGVAEWLLDKQRCPECGRRFMEQPGPGCPGWEGYR